jgi:hypothetical protein
MSPAGSAHSRDPLAHPGYILFPIVVCHTNILIDRVARMSETGRAKARPVRDMRDAAEKLPDVASG